MSLGKPHHMPIGPMLRVEFRKRMCHPVNFRGSRAIHLLVSVIQAEITRNQLLGMLGGITWLSMNNLNLLYIYTSGIELVLESMRSM